MVLLGEFDDIAPNKTAEQLTSAEVKRFIKGIFKKQTAGFDPNFIEKALKGLRVPMRIADPDARVFHFASGSFERLEQIGYGEF